MGRLSQYEGALDRSPRGHVTASRVGADLRSILLDPLLRLMRRDGAYAVVHTHPSDGPFSEWDALLLFLRPEVRALVVVGARGTVYLMSRLSSWTRPLFDELAQAYGDANARRDDETARLIAAGTMARWAARCEQVHRAWAEIARPFGLRYTRVEVHGR